MRWRPLNERRQRQQAGAHPDRQEPRTERERATNLHLHGRQPELLLVRRRLELHDKEGHPH